MSTSAPISVGSFLGLGAGVEGVVGAAVGSRVEEASTSIESEVVAGGGEGGRRARREAWVASSGGEEMSTKTTWG